MTRYLIYRKQREEQSSYVRFAFQALRQHEADQLIDKSKKACLQALKAAGAYAWQELLLISDDLLGPIEKDSFQQMLSAMAGQDVDCWCLAAPQPGSDEPPFLAIRREMYDDAGFQQLLDGQPDDFDGSLHALLAEGRWRCASYMPKGEPGVPDPLLFQPYTAVTAYGCPFVDGRCMMLPHRQVLRYSMGEEPVALLRYLKQQKAFDNNLLWDWLLERGFDLNTVENLGLVACLSTAPVPETEVKSGKKCCLLMHLFFTDLGRESLRYAQSMPPEADVFITTDTEEKKQVFQKLFGSLPNRVEIRVTENRGRDMASLLVSLRDVVQRYELCCFYHDKKSAFSQPGSGKSYAYLAGESALATPGYVQRILSLFESEPRLGVLTPVIPYHADYYAALARFWYGNFEQAQALLTRLGMNVQVDAARVYPAAWGNVFWFRPEALKPLLDYPWTYGDFPSEPYPANGCIAHAIERIYCLVAQSQGYYTSMAAPEHLAALELLNFQQYAMDYAAEMDRADMLGMYDETLAALRKALSFKPLRMKRKAAAWIRDTLGERLFQQGQRCLGKGKQQGGKKT